MRRPILVFSLLLCARTPAVPFVSGFVHHRPSQFTCIQTCKQDLLTVTSQRESWYLCASASGLASSERRGKRSRTKKNRMQDRRRKEDELVARPIYRNGMHRILFDLLVKMIALVARFVMCVMNKTVVHDEDRQLERAVMSRPSDIGLLTVSNHQSMMDDPAIWCCKTLPFRALGTRFGRSIVMVQEFYYCLGKLSAFLFNGLKCIPIRRGDLRGLECPTLGALHARLNGKVKLQANQKEKSNGRKEWCHIMAEGRILQPWRFDPVGKPRLGRLRKGAAKLIACSPPTKTIVLPMFHDGLAQILPETPPPDTSVTVRSKSGDIPENKGGKTERWFPRSGKRCDIFVGKPLDFSDIVPPDGYPFNEKIDKETLEAISGRLREALLELEQRAADTREKLAS